MSEARESAGRARALVEGAGLAALVLLGTWLQRRGAGVQSSWLAFLALLVGPAFRRALVLLGRARPAPAWLLGLELAGFGAAWEWPVAAWGLALEGAAALATASLWPSPVVAPHVANDVASTVDSVSGSATESSLLERAAPPVLLGLVFAFTLDRDPERLRVGTDFLQGALALVAAFTFAPGAAHTRHASARRVTVFALFLAEAFVLDHGDAAAESVTRVLATLGAALELGALAREWRSLARARAPETRAPLPVREKVRLAFGASVAALLILLVTTSLLARTAPARSVPALLLGALAVGLLLARWRLGSVDLLAPSSRRERALVPLLVLTALAASLPASWDRLAISADSEGYARHSPYRTPLYPALLDATDARPGEPLTSKEMGMFSGTRDLPDHRFVGAARAQKLLVLAGVALFLWVLGGSINAWLVGALAWFMAGVDPLLQDASICFNVGSLQTEGLNHSLVFGLLAATLAYLRRPRAILGVAVGLVMALLLLCRPGNAPFLAVFPVLWLQRTSDVGARRATGAMLAFGLVAAIPVLIACGQTYRATGYFRLHAFTGPSTFYATLSLATPEDLDAFPEPDLHEFVRRCVVDEGSRRISTESIEYGNVNLYQIGLPVLDGLGVLPPRPRRDYVQDDFLGTVGRRLIRRHPVAFARLALYQLRTALRWPIHAALAACFATSALLWWRRRRPLDLFGALVSALPVLVLLPTCVFSVPLDRYRSQLMFVELLAAPLCLALWLAPAPGSRTAKTLAEPGVSS